VDRALLAATLLCAGCLRDTTFHCTEDNQCGDQGKCEAGFGFCSFPDTDCSDGRRFGSLSGDQANQCVGSAGSGCSGYQTLSGQAHLYKLLDSPHTWDTQNSNCMNDGTYLAIPDDQNAIAIYPIATLTSSANKEVARAFLGYVTGAEGQAVLKSYGFLPPQ